MKDKTYRYSGPSSAVTMPVRDDRGALGEREIMLWSGRNVALPEDDPYTRTLLAQKLLEPVPAASAPAPAPVPARKPAAAVTNPTV